MNLRHICAAVGIAAFMVAANANATVHRVFPGESIQATIDVAAPGDTIRVEPGTYMFNPGPVEPGKYYYGLRIRTDNLRLIGKEIRGKGNAGTGFIGSFQDLTILKELEEEMKNKEKLAESGNCLISPMRSEILLHPSGDP